jgi:DNA polymerase-3 subunit epsilon
MDFAAIDFETATSRRNSACSVAVVEVRQGKMSDAYYTLLKPPDMRFNYYNIRIHGIHPADVQDAPTFAEAWPELRQHLAGRIVVAHNASFDMSVLRCSLAENHIAMPDFYYCCTVKLSCKVWPDLENHKLDTVGNYLHIDFQHHNALDDARTCACIPMAAGQQLHIDDFQEMASSLGVSVTPFNQKEAKR